MAYHSLAIIKPRMYSYVLKYLSVLTFFHNFDHSSYEKNYVVSFTLFAYYKFYYYRYFTIDLSFYIFAIIF
jgi:hypothetical protein